MCSEISESKMKTKEKIEMQYDSGNLRAAWQGIKILASLNQCANETKQSFSVNGVDDSDLPNTMLRGSLVPF